MTDSDRLRLALQKAKCPSCDGSGIGSHPHPFTGLCKACKGRKTASLRAFAASLKLAPSSRSLARWLSGKVVVPKGVIAWLDEHAPENAP